MRYALIFLFCLLACGCGTMRSRVHPQRVLREADAVLGREREVQKFEARLDQLDAQIEKGQVPDERVATVLLPAKPGYFPPRILRVVYQVSDQGVVSIKTADVASLGSRFTATGS